MSDKGAHFEDPGWLVCQDQIHGASHRRFACRIFVNEPLNIDTVAFRMKSILRAPVSGVQ